MQAMKLSRIVKAALIAGVLSCAALAQANPPPVESTPAVDVLPGLENFTLAKSEFVDNPRFGKDPFFPKSERRRAPKHVATTTPEPEVITADLSLQGISGQRGRKLCIINKRTFAIGESIEMRVAEQTVKVQCIEIKDRTVVVTVNGQRKELSLGQH